MEEIRESRRLARGDNGLDDGWTALPREICHGRMDPQGLLEGLLRSCAQICKGAARLPLQILKRSKGRCARAWR